MKLLLPIVFFSLFLPLSIYSQFSGNAPFQPEQGGLIINEFSNGEGGNNVKEYIELLVVGAVDNPQAPVDLEGWILDDNNIAVSGQGSATGHLIFGDCFSAVNPGSIIVIYNGLDRNPSIPADDPTDADRDGVYILSHTDDCLRACNITPSSSSSVYCPCPDTGEDLPAWPLGLRNGGDVVQVRDRCETVVHAIYWGGVEITQEVMNSPTSIDMGTQSQSGRLVEFSNTDSDDWNNRDNYDIRNFNNSETPGAGNSAANSAFIANIAAGTFNANGTVSLCFDTDAGDIVLPVDAGFFTSPIELCTGQDIGPFLVTYEEADENEPDAPGFNYEYAFILTQDINRIFTIIDFNTDGDFDFASLPPGTYQVWGFSYIQTNGLISVIDFLSSGFTTLTEIEAYSECGYDGDIDNLDALGNAVSIIIFDGVGEVVELPPLIQCEESNGEATFDLTALNDSLSTNFTVTWYKDEETVAEVDPADNFLSSSTTVFATIENDFCESEPIPLELQVVSSASLQTPAKPIVRCEESSGEATFDLTSLTDSILSDNSLELLWFEDMEGNSPIDEPATFSSTSNTVFAGIESEVCDIALVPVVLEVSSLAPVSIAIEQTIGCAGDATGNLSITSVDDLSLLTIDWNRDELDGIAAPQGLTAGDYNVTVSNADGCSQTASITLAEPLAVALSCSEATPASAEDLADGVILLNITGGTAPYSITWTGPIPGNTTLDTEGDISITDLLAGNYQFTIVDANNCPIQCESTLNFTPPVCDMIVEEDVQLISCPGEADGAITLTISGGRAPYDIAWSDGDVVPSRLDLAPGLYEAIITDANGCTENVSITLTDPSPLSAEISTLAGGCDAPTRVAINSITGGNPPYEFSPDGAFFNPIPSLPFSFDGLESGTYMIHVRDAGGCEVQREVVIETSAALQLELGPDQELQLGDSLVLKPILNFDPSLVSWTPTDGVSTADQLDAVLKPSFTTTYTLTLTDAGG
ncbi:MAG: SprB repeat-containing protein, partial [Saprospiraceae bacterium]|nr:SprB repeat-containing protein [Saprospiraceae bacterium]